MIRKVIQLSLNAAVVPTCFLRGGGRQAERGRAGRGHPALAHGCQGHSVPSEVPKPRAVRGAHAVRRWALASPVGATGGHRLAQQAAVGRGPQGGAGGRGAESKTLDPQPTE